MWWSTGSGRIELNITKADAQSASHSGPCDADIAWLRENRKPIIRQLEKLDPKTLRKELAEYGAWSEKELSDHDANLTRILWIACGDIADGHC